jgi:hypothetical protein
VLFIRRKASLFTEIFSEFKKGELKDTHIKYGNEKEEYALQLLDGGLHENKTPLMIVRIKGEPGYPKKNWTENSSDTVTGASEADSGQKGESTAALKTTATVKYEGCSAATEQQYNGIPATAYTGAFRHGEIGNTYFKSSRECSTATGNHLRIRSSAYFSPSTADRMKTAIR